MPSDYVVNRLNIASYYYSALLYLNSHGVDFEGGELAPIIFYIHGGAGKLGDAHKEMFRGQELAKQQRVCYIACNYRLGACARGACALGAWRRRGAAAPAASAAPR